MQAPDQPQPCWIQPIVIEGNAIRLEPLDVAHAADLASVATPDLFVTTPQAPREYTERGFIDDINRVNAIADSIALAVILRKTNRAIGRSTYMAIDAAHRRVEIGRTWIASSHHGTGLNFELKLLMLTHAFEHLSPPAMRVEFRTDGRNLRSRRAIEKIGASFEGLLRKERFVPSDSDPTSPLHVRDTAVFAIIDDDWPAVREALFERVGRIHVE